MSKMTTEIVADAAAMDAAGDLNAELDELFALPAAVTTKSTCTPTTCTAKTCCPP
jgi:hypothetical protein